MGQLIRDVEKVESELKAHRSNTIAELRWVIDTTDQLTAQVDGIPQADNNPDVSKRLKNLELQIKQAGNSNPSSDLIQRIKDECASQFTMAAKNNSALYDMITKNTKEI